MKQSYLLLLTLLWGFPLLVQSQKKQIPVFAGWYGPYAIQPGIKVGVAFTCHDWERSNATSIKSRQLYLSPQLGIFRRISNHTSYVLNMDFGYQRSSDQRKLYLSSSLGFAYLLENLTLSSTVDLSNGNITATDKELRSYFLPTVNVSFGKAPDQRLGWYSKVSYGRKVSKKMEDAGFFALEFGAQWALRKATSPKENTSL